MTALPFLDTNVFPPPRVPWGPAYQGSSVSYIRNADFRVCEWSKRLRAQSFGSAQQIRVRVAWRGHYCLFALTTAVARKDMRAAKNPGCDGR